MTPEQQKLVDSKLYTRTERREASFAAPPGYASFLELSLKLGNMSVSGRIIEGDELAKYLQRMPPEDLKSLLQDIALVEHL